MRALIQRVSSASVEVDEKIVGEIGHGLLVLLGVEDADEQADIIWLANKIAALRIFNDDEGLVNRSVLDIEGDVLVISQFTLHAKVKKGTRPSFIQAAKPDFAKPMYEQFIDSMEQVLKIPVQRGVFGAHMDVSLVNDGPVTIWIDTKNKE